MTETDLKALRLFQATYPTWWWKIGVCDVSRDFDAAPQIHSPEIVYAKVWRNDTGKVCRNEFDAGFMCDHPGSVADAIYEVMENIKTAIEHERTKG